METNLIFATRGSSKDNGLALDHGTPTRHLYVFQSEDEFKAEQDRVWAASESEGNLLASNVREARLYGREILVFKDRSTMSGYEYESYEDDNYKPAPSPETIDFVLVIDQWYNIKLKDFAI